MQQPVKSQHYFDAGDVEIYQSLLLRDRVMPVLNRNFKEVLPAGYLEHCGIYDLDEELVPERRDQGQH